MQEEGGYGGGGREAAVDVEGFDGAHCGRGGVWVGVCGGV